jgi:hypothetical protein
MNRDRSLLAAAPVDPRLRVHLGAKPAPKSNAPWVLLLVFATFAVAGCVRLPEHVPPEICTAPLVVPLPKDLHDQVDECMQREAAKTYWNSVQEKIMDAWELPAGIEPNRCAMVRFELSSNGAFHRGPEIVAGRAQEMRMSALRAVEDSSPFAPMPEGAECLEELPLLATFRNPLSP